MPTRRKQRKNRRHTHNLSQVQVARSPERVVVSTLAGMALLAASPAAQALSLGEITVHSSLGQRLDASVPVQLAAGESLTGECIQATRSGSSELSRIPNAGVLTPEATGPGQYTLRISSAAALYEPIYALGLLAACPGTAAISRQYVLMLDLPGMATGQEPVPAQPLVAQTGELPDALPASPARADVLRTAVPRERPQRTRRALDAMAAPIQPGTRYQVVSGDTLSSIAVRVSGRRVTLRDLAAQIFTANPAAFIRNDMNLIKLGSTIVIPAADTLADTASAVAPPASLPLPAPVPEAVAIPPAAALPAAPEGTATASSPAAETTVPPAAEAVPTSPILPAVAPVADPSKPAAAPTDAAAKTEASPLAATAAGMVFGLLVSALLWFRNRLPAITRKQAVKRPAKAVPAVENLAIPAAVAPLPIAVRTERAEPSITVQWSARPEDALAAEFATTPPARAPQAQPQAAAPRASAPTTDEITSELEKLFGDDSETMSTPAPAMPSMPGKDDGDGDQQAETLLQALSLLERDYEAELTASQVLDLSAMREALATGTDSMPFIKNPD
jgi:pilus assembly protein FimV